MAGKFGIKRTLLARDVKELHEELDIARAFGEAENVKKFRIRLLYLGLKGLI
jgi:hypothetical protein